MKNKTEYMLVFASTPGELVELVQNRLDDGWQLQGGVACSDVSYCQAVVRHPVSNAKNIGF